LTAALVIAGILAAVTNSWVVGAVAFGALSVIGVVAGDIRPVPGGRRQ
jgi:hypothetical protein